MGVALGPADSSIISSGGSHSRKFCHGPFWILLGGCWSVKSLVAVDQMRRAMCCQPDEDPVGVLSGHGVMQVG